MYTFTHMHTHTYAHEYTCACMTLSTRWNTDTETHNLCTNMHTHTHTHLYKRIDLQIHTHMHIYTYIHVHTHTHIHIYTHTHTKRTCKRTQARLKWRCGSERARSRCRRRKVCTSLSFDTIKPHFAPPMQGLHCTHFLKYQYPSTPHPLFPTYTRTVRTPRASAALLFYIYQMNRVHRSEEAPRNFTWPLATLQQPITHSRQRSTQTTPAHLHWCGVYPSNSWPTQTASSRVDATKWDSHFRHEPAVLF